MFRYFVDYIQIYLYNVIYIKYHYNDYDEESNYYNKKHNEIIIKSDYIYYDEESNIIYM
jgi:hypothetical protein